jgi:hypothetical protein
LESSEACDSFRLILIRERRWIMRLADQLRHRGRTGTGRWHATLAVVAMACAALIGARPAAAVELSQPMAYLYNSVSINPPSAKSMTICYGFVCRRREILDFTPSDKSALTHILAAGRASAAAERLAVQKAVVWFDRRVGPVIGTDKRIANADFRYFDDKHNFDCWDTTRNVTSLLLVMQDWGLFKFHVVGDPHYRGNALVLQTPHNTPVLIDRATQVGWVVDMWTRGYAQMPEVMTVDQWVKAD